MVNSDLNSVVLDCIFELFSISKLRLKIVKQICKVCNIIFSKGTANIMKPVDLARVVQVTEDCNMIDVKDAEKIREFLNGWHWVWGQILEKPELFLIKN